MSVLGPFALALVAGVLSFSSPCCLPLMPGYLAYVSGVAGEQVGTVAVRRRVLGSALLFVAGFTAVFTLLGATASLGGGLLLRNRDLLTRGAGAFVIVMGLATMGSSGPGSSSASAGSICAASGRGRRARCWRRS